MVVILRHFQDIEMKEEVSLLPHSYFKVLRDPVKMIDNKAQKECCFILLQQIQIPRSPKIIVWVDDNPQNNLQWTYSLEGESISLVTFHTTNEAISIMESYEWILMLRGISIRIVTNMHRNGNVISTNIAGI